MSTEERGKTGKGANQKVHPHTQSQPGLTREKYWFGTDEEVANREIAGDNSALHPPPAFKQIPAGDTGRDANNPAGPTRTGNMKFSGGPNPSGAGN
jgi:hypothetical protein